jgi:hypothetical protein
LGLLEIKYHEVREAAENNNHDVKHIPSRDLCPFVNRAPRRPVKRLKRNDHKDARSKKDKQKKLLT